MDDVINVSKISDIMLESINLNKKEEQELLDQLRNDLNNAISSESENIKESRDDMDFFAGKQYKDDYLAMAERYRKPTSVFNLLTPFHDQIMGDAKQNPPFITYKSADINTNKVNTNTMKALVKREQERSSAQDVYIKAFENATICGRGGFRIYPEYENGITFEQRIRIEAFDDPFDFFIDPNFENDFENMRYAFVNSFITKEQYKKEYGVDADDISNFVMIEDKTNWINDEKVRIVEYFYIEEEKVTIYKLEDGLVVTKSQYEAMKNKAPIVKERESFEKKVMWVKSDGMRILDKKQFPGSRIPIIPVFGTQYIHDGKRKYRGIVRNLKAAQVFHNFTMNSAIEMIAGMSKGKIVATQEQIAGFEKDWREWHLSPNNYVLYNNKGKAGEAIPPPPFALKQEYNLGEITSIIQLTLEEFKNISGIYDPSLGKENTGEKSGVALFRKQKQSLLNNFKYLDNLNKSLAYAGRILLDLIYLTVDETTTVQIEDEETGETRNVSIMNDLDVDIMNAKFSVEIEISNANETQREESKDIILSMLQLNPEIFPEVADKLMDLVDTPVAQVISERLKKKYNINGNDILSDPAVVEAMQQFQIKSEEEKNQLLLEQEEMQKQLAGQQALVASITAELNKANNKLALKEKSITIDISKQQIDKEKNSSDILLNMLDVLIKNDVSLEDPNVKSIMKKLTDLSFNNIDNIKDNIIVDNSEKESEVLADGVVLPGINDEITKASGTTPAELLAEQQNQDVDNQEELYNNEDVSMDNLEQQISGAIPRTSLKNN